MADAFIGEIRVLPFNFVPAGWQECNGQILQIMQFQALFSLIGTFYGGDGKTTFALPNLNGQVVMGYGVSTAPGARNYPFLAKTGVNTVALSTATSPAHNHQVQGGNVAVATSLTGTPSTGSYISRSTQAVDGKLNPIFAATSDGTTLSPGAVGVSTTGAATPTAHENRQPFQVLRFCIADGSTGDAVYPDLQ